MEALIPLEFQKIWIRVRCIPPIFFTLEMGERLGNFLGNFVQVDRGLKGDFFG